MKITFQGNPITLKGIQLRVGDKAPDFTLMNNELQPVTLQDTKEKRIFVVVPSIDTGVCDMEVRKFNEEASKLDNVTIYTISMDLPFAQARWCGAAGIKNVITLSDYKNREFGDKYGVYINELGLLTRAVFVLDEDNTITYVEYCSEVTNEPDYAAALQAVK
ncbi:MAG TPA: thiol peroxidase [Clostridium sp.]|uniref:thiol peroxidase n=1 Tax=unclassified Clostridium TaxID=2614128 RepID=UPI000EDA9C96|nr:thiol peroxidase [Clostridium sp.]